MACRVDGYTRDGREGQKSRGPLDKHTIQELTDTAWVISDNGAADGPDVVMEAEGLPRIHDEHPRVKGLMVVSLVPSGVAGRIDLWRVAIKYSEAFEEDADVDIDFEEHKVPVVGGLKLAGGYSLGGGVAVQGAGVNVMQWGVAIANSAQEQYIPVPEDDDAFMVVRISRNEAVTDLEKLKKFTNSVNEKPWLGGDPQQWRMMCRARPIPNHPAKMWRLEYFCKFNRATWDLQLLDQGRYYRANPGAADMGAMIPFKNDEKDNVIGNLDGTGGRLAADKPPVFRRFVRRAVVDWGELNLEETIKAFYAAGAGAKPLDIDWNKVPGVRQFLGK